MRWSDDAAGVVLLSLGSTQMRKIEVMSELSRDLLLALEFSCNFFPHVVSSLSDVMLQRVVDSLLHFLSFVGETLPPMRDCLLTSMKCFR